MEHLTELRDRLIKVVIARRRSGWLIAFVLYDQIFDFLIEPYEDIANADELAHRRRAARRSTRSRASASA